MCKQSTWIARTLWVAGFCASNILISTALAQSAAQPPSPAPAGKPPAAGAPYRFQPNRVPGRAKAYYALVPAVQSLRLKSVVPGDMIRFCDGVLDAEQAK